MSSSAQQAVGFGRGSGTRGRGTQSGLAHQFGLVETPQSNTSRGSDMDISQNDGLKCAEFEERLSLTLLQERKSSDERLKLALREEKMASAVVLENQRKSFEARLAAQEVRLDKMFDFVVAQSAQFDTRFAGQQASFDARLAAQQASFEARLAAQDVVISKLMAENTKRVDELVALGTAFCEHLAVCGGTGG